ncbi:glycosyltransferase family 2 protein [Trujillonella endophytica]|uniref:Glycosyltransferase involved in cell wall bisynthesis n=1 Tax=Trujillonella endophytica TaxID=673521 RepID=A0A1H8RWP2_9ACTN|nr:glycosyltransferase family 2 protein [Trujillella endophytica]SEO70343.1 Glycosyltransferase involved in cell wall bisynthesis [Trujillella endophytica]
MKAVIAIPAYNCGPQIGRVLDEITDELAARVAEIWVIDNRSTDDTLQRALDHRRSGRLPNLRVFRNRQNNSLGGTHKVAFEHARAAGHTHVVILHGDNQARSDEAGLLLDLAEAHPETQTVLGSRFSRHSRLHGYDAKRIWGNRALNAVYSVVALRRLQDLGSGLNLFALRDLDPATYLRFANHLTFNYELILDLVRRGVRFAYLPITWREEDQVSNARNWNIFRTALRNLALWRLGRRTSDPAPDRDYEWDEVR